MLPTSRRSSISPQNQTRPKLRARQRDFRARGHQRAPRGTPQGRNSHSNERHCGSSSGGDRYCGDGVRGCVHVSPNRDF
jgi:hypothetical protein